MMKLIRTLTISAMMVVCIAQPGWAATGGTMKGSIAEYNAGQVRIVHGMLTVPAKMVTYTANTAIPANTNFTVTLPQGFEFTTEPTLSSSEATLTLVKYEGGTAQFIVSSGTIAVSGTIVLGGYNLKGATALEEIIPAGAALPLTMQAVGIDPNPLPFKEFASDSGIQATVTGNTNTLDVDLGSLGKGAKFFIPPSTFSTTAQLASIMITAETKDLAGNAVLSPDGNTNTLKSAETVTVELPGVLFGGVNVFASTSSTCSVSSWKGFVIQNALYFPNLPFNRSVYLCVKASGSLPIKLIGYPSGENTLGFSTGLLLRNLLEGDFLSSGNVQFSPAVNICYTVGAPSNLTCAPEFYKFLDLKDSADAHE